MDKGQSVGLTPHGSTDTLSEEELCPAALLARQEAAYARDIRRLRKKKGDFVSVPCPACQGQSAGFAFTKHGFHFLRCAGCDTVYMSPRPTEAIMASYYADSENYRCWARHIFPATEASRREKVHRPRLERIIAYCRRFAIHPGALLEMGPGFGTFAQLAKDSGFFQRVLVVEPTPEMAEACRARGLETHACRIEDLPPDTEPMQCIVAFEVIEHLFSVRPVLLNLAPRLAEGGLLVLTCPNGRGFDIATLGSKSLSVDSEHVNLFNPHSLSLLLEKCGFEVLETSTPGKLDAEFVREAALKKRISLEKQPFLRRVLLEDWQNLGQPFQAYLADNGLSSHMWIVARKKR